METKRHTTVLFTGYAPVHFLCFRPLFERLREMEGFDVFVSGGLRTKIESGYAYDEQGMYAPFDIPASQVLSVDEIRLRDFDFLFSACTKLIEPRRVATKVQIFHGISFRNRAIREANTKCDAYFFVGPYMKRKFVEAGLFDENDPRILPIGFAKTDKLINDELDRTATLKKYGLDGSRPMLLFAPTGDKHNSLEIMGEEVVEAIRDSGKYDLIIKPHDHAKNKIDWFEKLAPLADAHTKIVRELDVIPLLHAANLLITDASSVSNEYALLDRPMIFLDVPKLIARMMERKESMLDMDTWGRHGGVVVKKANKVVAAIEESLANPARHSEVRRAMAADLFYHPGCATDHAIKWITQRAAVVGSTTTSVGA